MRPINSKRLLIFLLSFVLISLISCNNQTPTIPSNTTNTTPLREPLSGTCECPYDLTNSGRKCGKSSSYSRPSGDKPACYVGEGKATADKPEKAAPKIASQSINLTMGNPSNATSDANNKSNYLVKKPQFAFSYNNSKGTANWVSWQLNQSWMGNVDRQNNFRPDTSLPADYYQVRSNEYQKSGYDRGHLIPSADRSKTAKDNSATFLMTNMIPQHPDNNREVWRELEEYSRELVKQQGKELYIVAGPKGKIKTLAKGKLTVPASTWKVILVLDKPGSGVSGVTANTRTIAVMMPNSEVVNKTDWKDYRVSVDQVEKETGYDFFSNLPKSIQKQIESRVDK